MKKWIGTICSGLAGVLSLLFLALPAFKSTAQVIGNYSGWELLTNKNIAEWKYSSVVWYRIFVWILVIVAVALIVATVFQILSNVGLVKMPAILATISKYAIIVAAITALLALIANFGIRAEWGKEVEKYISIGISLWFVSVVNIVTAVCANVFAKKSK